MQPKFALEPASLHLVEELLDLFLLHYREIAHYQDIRMNPDYDLYMSLAERGILRVYTAREEGRIIGYGVFTVQPNSHYKDSLQGRQDIFFIHPGKRGFGREFNRWIESQLKLEGVQVIVHHVKAKPEHNWSPMLLSDGYELMDLLLVKRLDKEDS